jgi:hypothetical protein
MSFCNHTQLVAQVNAAIPLDLQLIRKGVLSSNLGQINDYSKDVRGFI